MFLGKAGKVVHSSLVNLAAHPATKRGVVRPADRNDTTLKSKQKSKVIDAGKRERTCIIRSLLSSRGCVVVGVVFFVLFCWETSTTTQVSCVHFLRPEEESEKNFGFNSQLDLVATSCGWVVVGLCRRWVCLFIYQKGKNSPLPSFFKTIF